MLIDKIIDFIFGKEKENPYAKQWVRIPITSRLNEYGEEELIISSLFELRLTINEKEVVFTADTSYKAPYEKQLVYLKHMITPEWVEKHKDKF